MRLVQIVCNALGRINHASRGALLNCASDKCLCLQRTCYHTSFFSNKNPILRLEEEKHSSNLFYVKYVSREPKKNALVESQFSSSLCIPVTANGNRLSNAFNSPVSRKIVLQPYLSCFSCACYLSVSDASILSIVVLLLEYDQLCMEQGSLS